MDKEILQMNQTELFELIKSLINLGHEGEWWDFKRQWPDNPSLLHDIICMANNVSFRTALLIIGVDEEDDFSFCTTDEDDKAKNTQMLVDFLKGKPFLGGERPEVEVRKIYIDKSNCIDIVVISSTHSVPYVLFRDWKCLKAGNVYTRVCDSNTSTNAIADLDKTEKLWRHHFYMDVTPVEKMSLYITDHENWHSCYGNEDDMSWFYTRHPEYVLGIVDDDRGGSEYYNVVQPDRTPHWGLLYLRYHQTVINMFNIIYLDGGRYFNVAPNTDFIEGCFCKTQLRLKFSYCYFIKDTDKYRLFELFNYMQIGDCSACSARNRFVQFIVIYESLSEKETIDRMIDDNVEAFRELVANNRINIYMDETFNEEQKEYYLTSFAVVKTINKWLSDYRKIASI